MAYDIKLAGRFSRKMEKDEELAGRESYLIKLSEKVYDKCFEWHFHRLTKPEQVFYCIWEMEAQVNNGGFHQYFFNSGDHVPETIKALEEIGASYTAELLKKACTFFPDGKIPEDFKERRIFLSEMSKAKQDELYELDNLFYEYKDDLSKLLYAYTQNNLDMIKGA